MTGTGAAGRGMVGMVGVWDVWCGMVGLCGVYVRNGGEGIRCMVAMVKGW